MTDDGALATGGMSGITEDTPEHAGAPDEAGSVDRVSAFGGEPETGEEEATLVASDDPGTAPEATTANMDDGREQEEGLVSGIGGGVTGTSDL